ncbi:hypothetical protein TTHERM_00289290 (macronuclear) [Tetrahymena thermophila SB210]|uniref:Uncharacterized protein n=1 Tax=Tetrahymena thermophila (strain SB210) TaxID=312017 RepID=I7MKG8_TETTS|nr:hypothetical protein TTHERM_00289290 [Tetrahymena thermophila SB210]EAR98401.3 hypothetical protein TTHERM_00289290 [Tetrahymena thermophila SB210]|eukprot:XP_001018646.3 hypothetical protein TTHERM_00289290 [Tetrahymena thermophila SB210]
MLIMETPQFSAKDKNGQNSQSSFHQEILRAPKKNQTKKTLQIKKNIILTSDVAHELRKINFNDSPLMNQFILMHARVFQDSKTPQTPIKNYRETLHDNNLFEEKESTVVQSAKRKFIERDYDLGQSDQQQMIDENISHTEKKFITSECKQEYEGQDSKKRLKPLLPFKSSIKFSCKKNNSFSAFNLYRDKEIHTNISRFPQNFKKQDLDYDCSSEEERTEDQIIFMSEEIIKEMHNNQSYQYQDATKSYFNN